MLLFTPRSLSVDCSLCLNVLPPPEGTVTVIYKLFPLLWKQFSAFSWESSRLVYTHWRDADFTPVPGLTLTG